MTIILNNQGCTTYPNGTAGDPLRAVEFRVMLRGADAPPPDSGLFRITIEPQPPPAAHDGPSGPAEPPSPPQESSGPETASAGRSGGFTSMAKGSTSRWLDVKVDPSIEIDGVRINGTPLIDPTDLLTWLTTYAEECRESRDAAADEGDYESAIRNRTRAEVLDEVVERIEAV